MIVLNTFDGFLGTHKCQYCKTVNPVPANVTRIGHFKKFSFNGHLEFSSYLSRYTPTLKKMISICR